MAHHASWLKSLVEPETMVKAIDFLMSCLKDDSEHGVRVDAIAVRGVSGAVVGGALSFYSGLPLIIVRKPNDGTHSDFMVEYDDETIGSWSNYVFVDDLCASGDTYKAVMSAINGQIGAVCVGSYLYHGSQSFKDSCLGLPCHGSGDYDF